jgi:hypothetical protein
MSLWTSLAALRRSWRRRRYRESVSAPYLSGDLFRAMCDVALEPAEDARRRFRSGLAGARAVFVKTDLLPEFLDRYARHATACRVLVTGNSDLEVGDVPAGLPPRLRRWFAQNAMVTDDVIRLLPIGLENQALGRNGLSRYYRPCRPDEIAAKRLRLFAAFAPTTPERDGLLGRLARSPLVDVARRRLGPRRYQDRLRRYRFVVAPRGNGIDTHRLWEALYADAIPVTRKTAWSVALRAEGIPVLEVDGWDEVGSWTADDLAGLSRAFPVRPSADPWLWEGFWRDRIAAVRDGP